MFQAFAMFITVLFLATWIPANWRRRIVGAGLMTDITVHLVLQSMFGGDAAGRAALLFAGLFINATMHLYRYMWGYEKLTPTGWKRYAGRFS